MLVNYKKINSRRYSVDGQTLSVELRQLTKEADQWGVWVLEHIFDQKDIGYTRSSPSFFKTEDDAHDCYVGFVNNLESKAK